jgi:hypothetical protein
MVDQVKRIAIQIILTQIQMLIALYMKRDMQLDGTQPVYYIQTDKTTTEITVMTMRTNS